MIYAKNESACEQINGSHWALTLILERGDGKEKGEQRLQLHSIQVSFFFPFYASSIIVVGHLADVETLTPSSTACRCWDFDSIFKSGCRMPRQLQLISWTAYTHFGNNSKRNQGLQLQQWICFNAKHLTIFRNTFMAVHTKMFMKSSAAQKTSQEVWM